MSFAMRPGPALSERTTLGIGGPCLAEAVVRTEADLDSLGAFLATQRGRPFVIGAGSNLLADDQALDLVLIRPQNSELEITERKERVLVRVEAGMKLPLLLSKMQQAGLTGLESLVGIPGSVGGALAMNAGSYGMELGQKVVAASLWTPLEGLNRVDREQMHFGYRSFDPSITGKWLTWSVEIELQKDDPIAIKQRMDETMSKKKATQPVTLKTAGCVFKNPEGHSAGKLLDQAGMKGEKIGDMEFSSLHANFLVNQGKGTFAQAMELIELGKQAVKNRFGVTLETEVIILT